MDYKIAAELFNNWVLKPNGFHEKSLTSNCACFTTIVCLNFFEKKGLKKLTFLDNDKQSSDDPTYRGQIGVI